MMLLQTLLQLNILILASLALAGWTLIPFAQPGAVRAVCIVWQGRTVDAVTPKSEQTETVRTRAAVCPQLPLLPRYATSGRQMPTDQVLAAPAAFASFNPFPHAARAP